MGNFIAQRAERLRLEYHAMSGTDKEHGMNAYEAEIAHSTAISLKRIADIMEQQAKPVCVLAEDIERDPLMLIARAIEELARPTLPQDSDYQTRMIEIAERECKALETVALRLDHLTDYFDENKAQLRVGANCDVRQVG